MNTLKDMFDDVMNREGKEIIVNAKALTVFFRKNNNSNFSMSVDSFTELYAYADAPLNQGDEFTINGISYLIIRKLTPENEVYQKFTAVKYNQIVKYMLKNDKASSDLTEFRMYQLPSYGDSLDNGTVVTIGSKAEFKLSLNDLSKRIKVNDRFFTQSTHAVWKITDLDYKDGAANLYCERDIITEHDDVENGIADRFSNEPQPEPQPVGEIKVEPPYDESDCYAVIHHDTQIFTASIEGVENPQWEITLDAQGMTDSYYESVIDNAKGTFTITNNKPNKTKLKYTIKEVTSGKSIEYYVKLASLF